MGLIAAFLVLVAIALAVVLLEGFLQNRALWTEVRAAPRPVGDLLRDALVIWCPLAVFILLMVFTANRLSAGAIGLTYRLSTLDEFCEVGDGSGHIVIACTDMHGRLAPGRIRLAGAAADLEAFVSGKFRAARTELLSRSADGMRAAVANRPTLYRAISAPGVLGLEQAPEDDPELARLKQELRALIRTPAKPASDLFDMVRFVGDRSARELRMRELTGMVLARREMVNRKAYAGWTREQQGRLWLRYRLSHLLAQVSTRPDKETEAAFPRMVLDVIGADEALSTARRGTALTLARNEAAAMGVLGRETRTRSGAASLYLALAMPRGCTVAEADPTLRLRSSDFDEISIAPAAGDAALETNSGSFPCPRTGGFGEELHLRPLGFRESVHRSIDRALDGAQRVSFRRLGQLSLSVDAGQDEALISRQLERVIPTGIQLGRADCGLLQVGNCVSNLANSAAEAGYARARADMQTQYRSKLDSATGAVAIRADQRIGQSVVSLDLQLQELRSSAHAYVDRLLLVNTLLRIIAWLALALIVIKSFLYVLALELFHSDEQMGFGLDANNPVEGDYRADRQITIDRDFPYPMITRKQLSNADNNLCIAPWPWSSPLARILRGRYFIFTRGSFLADAQQAVGPGLAPRGMVASAGAGLSIVEWRMKPGEEVVFRYKDFFGASDNVRLDSEISFRLSTLLLGKIVFHTARCIGDEGRLLLKAHVEHGEQEDIRAIPPERLIAWNRHARFTIHSGRTAWTTLLNGYTLVRKDNSEGLNGRVVVSSEDVGSSLGSIRYLRRIFRAVF